MPPTTFAIMPGRDDVIIFGLATIKQIGIDLYPLALEKLRPHAVPVQPDVENSSYLAAWRVTISVNAFQTE